MSASAADSLPPRYSWNPITAIDPDGGVQLRLDGAYVVAVVGVSAGRWHCTVNMHRGVDRVRWSYCGSRAQGMRWAERWLRPRADRVAAAIAHQDLEHAPGSSPSLSREEKREERARRG